MPNSISKVVVLSSSCAERIGDTDKMKIVINAAVVDIEDNFLPLEAMDIYVNNKLVDTNTSDASGELTMTLQLDYNADTEVIVYAEHKVSGQKSPKKLLPLKGQSQNIIQVTAEENISETITLISKGEAIAKIRHDGLLLGKPEFSHLIDDTSVVTEAVKQNGLALEFASERLKKDITIFNVAVEQNEDAALFAEEELYKRYRQALVKSKHGWLDMEFSDNRIIFLPYIKEHKMKDFHNLSSRFRDDKEIMLYVVMHDGDNLFFASDRLKDDKDLVLAAAKQSSYALDRASERLKDDKDLVLAVAKHWCAIPPYISQRLQNDPDIKKAAGI